MDETPSGVTSGGMGYNVITVGNYDLYNEEIRYTSSYNDDAPALCYKPDICAPGRTVFNFMDAAGDYYASGTSYAAPLVVGTVALMMCEYSSLKTDPLAVKAIITAAVDLDARCYVLHKVDIDNMVRVY